MRGLLAWRAQHGGKDQLNRLASLQQTTLFDARQALNERILSGEQKGFREQHIQRMP
ncbi:MULTISPECIES: hypothetical protein [Thiomonas]|uniref:hypothetical protein n=1 Tax=Thiomonas TaxID=32012 RepID=UPI0023F2372B|nr:MULTISPECIES: hypothetical protein [Thiomonas]